ncbi:hypothetical protein Tco_1450838 [Tanacetum coccineum]
MFKVDSLKVIWEMLEIIKLREHGLSIPLEMEGQINQGVKDSKWFKDKMLLAQAQEIGVVLKEADHVDAYDLDCDGEAITNAILMQNLSPVGSLNDDMVEPHFDSDMLSKVPHYDTYHDSNMLNSNIQEQGYIEKFVSNNESYDELTEPRDGVTSYTQRRHNPSSDGVTYFKTMSAHIDSNADLEDSSYDGVMTKT